MTRVVIFRTEAVAEALEARQWYEERRRGFGEEFGTAVDDAIARIAATPLAFPCVHGETRRAILRRFPYAIYFRILDDDIVILAVHGRQDPRRWQERS